jgi:hypothetical protein
MIMHTCVTRVPYSGNAEKAYIGAMNSQQDGSSIIMSLGVIKFKKVKSYTPRHTGSQSSQTDFMVKK